MWAEAAKWINKFPEAVVTVTDTDGYPASVRVSSSGYDANTGEIAVPVPAALTPVAGPASLMCHSHDEKLWKLQFIAVRGKLESRDGAWVFRSERFDPPPKLGVMSFVRNLRRSAQKYLDKRGLTRPQVNWAAIKEVQRRIKG